MTKKPEQTITRLLIALALTCCLCSCALKNTSGPEKSVETLKASVNSLWSARMQGDWGEVYDRIDRNYQKNTPRAEFIAQGEMKVIDYEIKELNPDPSGPGQYEVMVRFSITKMGFTLKPVVRELWVFEGRKWVLNKSLMNSVKPL